MRSKKYLKILFMVYLIVLAITIKIFPLENSKMGLMNAIDDIIQTYQDTVTQEPIDKITDKMYVTLIDEKSRVIATTNPNTKIDTTNKIKLTDNISILFEIPTTKDNTIKDDIYYYLDLPEYIIPNEENIIGSENGPSEPIDLISSSSIKAIGGIYKNSNGYRFKIKFTDTKDQLDIKATYQFNSKLSETSAPNEGINNIDLDFGIAGKLQLVVDIPITPVEPEKDDLELKVKGEWEKTSKGANTADATWTTTITDNREEKQIPAGTKLSLNFPGECSITEDTINDPKTNCIATTINGLRYNPDRPSNESPLQIYADGEKLEYTRDDYTKWNYQMGDTILILEVSNFSFTRDAEDLPSLVRSLNITFDGDINNIKEWKFVFLGETYNIDDSTDFTLDVKLTGAIDDELTDSYTVVKNISDFNITQGVTSNKEDACLENGTCPSDTIGNDMPMQLIYNLKTEGLKNAASKYIKIEVDPSFENTYNYADYYAHSWFFSNPSTFTYFFEKLINSLKIDGQSIKEYSGTGLFSTADNYIYLYDPIVSAIYAQLLKYDSRLAYAYFSSSKYDGERYYIIAAPEISDIIRQQGGFGSVGVLWDETTQKPLKWNIYIFNIDGREVDMQYYHGLGKVDIDTSQNSNDAMYITNKVTVSDAYGTASTTSKYTGNISTDIAVKTGTYAANNIIQWNVDVDTKKLINKYFIDNNNDSSLFGPCAMFTKMYENQKFGNSDDYLSNLKQPELAPQIPEKFNLIMAGPTEIGHYSVVTQSDTNFSNDYEFKSNLEDEDGYKIWSLGNMSYYHHGDMHSSITYYTYFNELSSLMDKNSFIKEKTELINNPRGSIGFDFSSPANKNSEYRIKTTGVVPTAQLSKSHVSTKTMTDDSHNQITNQVWNIHADTSSYDEETDKTYYYNGHIDISDDMTNSTISTSTGTNTSDYNIGDEVLDDFNSIIDNYEVLKIDNVKVGEFTKLNSITIKYSDLNDNEHSVIMNVSDVVDGVLTTTEDGVTITLKYNDNMEQGFNIALDNLVDVSNIDITYNTTFDHKAFAESLVNNGVELSSSYNINFKNNAYLPNTDIKAEPATDEIKVTTYLEITKHIEDYNSENGNYSKKYTIDTTTGYSMVPYLDLTDSINRYLMIDKKANVLIPYITDSDAVKALASSFNLENIVITKLDNNEEGSSEIIYQEGTFIDSWNKSTFVLSEDNNDGLLYTAHFENISSSIAPGTTFRIEYIGNLDMEHILDNGQTFRASNYYPEPAQRLFIDSLVNAKVEHQSINPTPPVSDISIGEQITSLTQVASINASNVLSVYGGAAGTYLKLPETYKQLISQIGTKTNWEYGYKTGTIGKSSTITKILIDSPTYKIDNDIEVENKNIFTNLLNKYQIFSDITLRYTDDEYKDYLVSNVVGVLTDEVVNKINNTSYKLTIDNNNNLLLDIKDMPLNTIIKNNYTLDIDIDSFKEEARQKSVFNDYYQVVSDEENGLMVSIGNALLDDIESLEEEWGSKAIITEASINKIVKNNDDKLDETTWSLTLSTGTSNLDNITINDIAEVLSQNELISKSMYIDDILIKIDNIEVYNSSKDNPYSGGFDTNNLDININNLTMNVNIKNSNDNKVIGNNQMIIIEYKTKLNKEKYGLLGGVNKAEYIIKNEAKLISNNQVLSDASSTSSKYNIDEPIDVTKTNLGNNSDLSETKFKIVTNTKNMSRLNYTISDELSSEYKKYLSIKDIIIKVNDEVYDINNVNIYKKGTKDKFEFNSIGNTDFDIVFDKLNSNTKIEVEYIVKLDKNSYLLDNNYTDVSIDLNNSAIVSSNDGAQANSNSKGSVSVPSKFTKQGRKKGFSVNNLPLLEWSINVNLLSEYTPDELENAEIIINDKLNPSLRYYEDSIVVYNRITTPSGSKRGTKISKEDYEFTIEDNVLNIKLLKPNVNSNIEIVFSTESITSLSQLDNNATLTINGKTEEVKSDTLDQIITTNTSGTVTSTKVGTFTINAYKLLDGKASTIPFKFRAVEVDEEGNIIEDGYNSIVNNSEDGLIRFDSVRFIKEGTYYYEISEIIDEESKQYNYDKENYILKLKVEKKNNAYIVTQDEIIGPDNREEIIFNNKTIPKDKPNNIDVPNTIDNIVKYLIMMILSVFMIVISTIVFRKRLYRK